NLATQEVQSNFNGLDVTFDNNEVLVKWYDKFGFVRYPKAQISVFPNVGDQRTGGNRMIDYSATYSEIYDSFERSNASGVKIRTFEWVDNKRVPTNEAVLSLTIDVPYSDINTL